MSEVRLVRCPKCDNVLPEPSGIPIYKCGGCGAVLRAKKKSLVGDGLLDGSGEAKLVNSSNSNIDKEGALDMAIHSPARSSFGDGDGIRLPLGESGLTEFHGGLPKSPMRERFLDDLVKTPVESRGASRSPMRERAGSGASRSPMRERAGSRASRSPLRGRFLDDLVKTPVESRNASRSPMRGRALSDDFDHHGVYSQAGSRNVRKSPVGRRGRTPLSMTKSDGGSPMRDGRGLDGLDSVDRSPARSMNGNAPKSPLRLGRGFEVEGNVEQGRVGRMTPKTSFSSWLPDEQNEGQSSDNYPGGRRSTWRDRVESRPEPIGEEVESVFSNEHEVTADESLYDSIHGSSRSKGGKHKDRRTRSDFDGGYARSDVIDGPSRYSSDPVYGYGGQRHSFESTRGPASVHELQLQRVELLRKYNELKDQLVNLDGDGVSSSGFYSEHGGSSVDESSRLGRGPMQQFPSDRNVQRPSHFSHGPGRAQQRAAMYNSNQSLYDDRFGGQMIRGSNQSHLSEHGIHGYVAGHSLDFDRESYVSDTHVHHPACGCPLCCSNDWQGQDRHSSLGHRRYGSSVTNSVSSHSRDLDRYGPRTYDPIMAHTDPRGRLPRTSHHHPMTHEVASPSKRLCRPISGGAPFVLCSNCFQLLKLPGNFMAKHKNQQLKCGACSTVTLFDLQQRSPDPSSQKNPDSVDVTGGSREATKKSDPKQYHESVAATSANEGSYDFDAGGYNFPSMNSEASRASKGHRSNSSLAESAGDFASSPSRFSVDDLISNGESVYSSQPNSSEMPMEINPTLRPPPGSPLQHHLDYSTQFHKSQAEKQTLEKSSSPESPLVPTDATETEVHLNEVPTSGVSQDSRDTSAESQVPRSEKVPKSPIDALLKGFASLSGRRTPGSTEVYVNGQVISHRMAKKAEKLAGNIQPGDYWYDPKAGFWGVMGHRCFGIIPPCIQEFSFPMPENCSRGTTAIYVNGRELHELDLDLLAGRGLPTTRDNHYVVDISGKVLDEETGDFIVNLGRLAPSVEKKKCGFGMQVPAHLDDD